MASLRQRWINFFLPATYRWTEFWTRHFSLTVRQRGRILWGRPFCMIIIAKAMKSKSEKQFPKCRKNWLLLCNNSPLSKSLPQSCGKRGWWYFCLVRWIFQGVSALIASVSNVEICLLFFLESVYFTLVDLEKLNFKYMRGPQIKKFSPFLCMKWKWNSLSYVWLFATPWTIQSMEFSSPE